MDENFRLTRRKLIVNGGLTAAASLFFPNLVFSSDVACDVTTGDIEGPFYMANAPFINKIAPNGAPGEKLFISGTVYANDCSTPLAGAIVDVWQANDAGDYENVDYRGKITTDASGQYAYETILPGKYLNGAEFRPRHIHYKVSAPPDTNELTTQLYFDGDTSIPNDPWASDPAAADRTIPLTQDMNNDWNGVFDIHLDIDPPIVDSIEEPQSGNARMLSCFPNPATYNTVISYQLARSGQIRLQVLDIRGRLMDVLVNERQAPGAYQHTAYGKDSLGNRLPAGLYIYQLMIDGKGVDAKRMYWQ